MASRLLRLASNLESIVRNRYGLVVSDPVKYITDDQGERTALVLPICDYEKMLEDLDDLAVVSERRDEPIIPLEQFVSER